MKMAMKTYCVISERNMAGLRSHDRRKRCVSTPTCRDKHSPLAKKGILGALPHLPSLKCGTSLWLSIRD
jgi:hypothetical protein